MFSFARLRTRGLRVALALFALLLVIAPTAAAAGPTVTIDSVGGRQVVDGRVNGSLSGRVLVNGTAMPTAQGSAPAAKPLVADAGDSGFGLAGEPIALLGSGYGGTEPYRFAWSAATGAIDGADAPTALFQTAGLAAGIYTVGLRVTDSAGATANDTVKVVVAQPEVRTILNETRQDVGPGALGSGALAFPFTVPTNATRIEVHVEWGVAANDYDLRVLDPAGAEVASSGNGAPENFEDAAVANPGAGTWTAMVDKFATVADTVRMTVTATLVADPRPVAEAGGPYRFAIGAAQTLRGTATGGTAPLTVGWDTDEDGKVDRTGATVTTNLPAGRRLATFKVTDARGLERREMVSVLVANPERLAAETTAVTVVAINDSGINPYHFEFSAATYPDPDVLALTNNFRRHPSEYIPGYPAGAKALPITLGQGYFPPGDSAIWTTATIAAGDLYWIPGTKIVGAIDAGGSTGATSGDDLYPILDDNGHGTGSASVSTGNRYGYCPTCLLVVVEALDEAPAASFPWVDISSNSFGPIGGAPVGLALQLAGLDPAGATRRAAERGQTILFAAGNGVGNAFDVPVSTYTSDGNGPDWNITVGAIRRDNERAIVGDGIPVHISAWGDGNLPSACRTGTASQCAFGGTSAATPYTAGIFGTVLTEVRRALGDGEAGQKAGQVVAEGFPMAASPYLSDGKLTRAELREAVLKTALPLNQENNQSFPIYPFPLTAPYAGDLNVLFEGYGAATPAGARRAIDVLFGRSPLPDRSFEDEFFALDRQIRDSLWGGYDRDGDGAVDSEAAVGAFGLGVAAVETPEAAMATLRRVANLAAPALPADGALGQNALRYYLHRNFEAEPGTPVACDATINTQTMDSEDRAGDLEPCFDSRVTSVVAAYRPVGIFPATSDLETPLPAGSTVYVELYMAGETPSAIRPTGVLMAGDREIGTGAAAPQPVVGSGPGGAACAALGEACWTKFTFSFDTTRPAIAGEHLTFQVQLLGARAWAFGHEGAHASRITIVAAPLPASGLDFGATITAPAAGSTVPNGEVVAMGAARFPDLGDPGETGDRPTVKKVQLSLDDPSFARPIEATLDEARGVWSAPIGRPTTGGHTLYARALRDNVASPVASSAFTVSPLTGTERVEWQVVRKGAQPDPAYWRPATGVLAYRFEVNTAVYGQGLWVIHVRLLENGAQTATSAVEVRFSGR